MAVTAHVKALRAEVFEHSPAPLIVIDAATDAIIDCNGAAVSVCDLPSVDAALGMTFVDLSARLQYDRTPSAEKAAYYMELARTRGSIVFEWKYQRPDGHIWDAEVRLLDFHVGEHELYQCSIVDITQRKVTERVRQIEHDLVVELNSCTTLSEGLGRVLEVLVQFEYIDSGGVYVVNPADGSLDLIAHRGFSQEFVARVTHFDAGEPNVVQAATGRPRYGQYAVIGQQYDAIRAREGLRVLATIPIVVKGQFIAVLNLTSHQVDCIPEATRQSLESIAYQIGVSLLRLKSDAALRENEEIFSQFMANSPVYIFFKDEHIRSLRLSRNYEKMLGRPLDELLGKTMDELFPSDLAKSMVRDDLEILAQGIPQAIEEEFNGRFYTTIKFPIHIEGRPRYLAGYTIDITERKQAEEALRNVQKLESLSLLAGGIAHDFNNLLGGVFGYIDLARDEPSSEGRAECLEGALAAIGRARALTQQLLTFAKGGAPVKSVQSMDPFVRDTVRFALSGSAVSCRFDIAPDLWHVEFDKHQLGQVIDNIVINAHQAMSNGGTIDVQVRNVRVEDAEYAILRKGQYVRISIRDFGIGIPKEYLSRIFDPFFTTKPQGHGLGLATCYSIVARHGGCINVESEPGQGSVFHVLLPAHVEKPSPDTREADTSHTGRGTFIVMDDEPLIRGTIDKMLKSFGYTPVSFEDGRLAIDYLLAELQAGRQVAAMMFDLTVPGKMGGTEAAFEIRRLGLTLPIFVASGYADDPVMARPGDYGFTASICKPFVRRELALLLNASLNSARTDSGKRPAG